PRTDAGAPLRSLHSRAGDERGVAVAVVLVGRVSGSGVDRLLLAVGDGRDASGLNAVADQELAHGVGAPRAEGEVVLAGAAFVAVALDAHLHRRVALQPFGLSLEDGR